MVYHNKRRYLSNNKQQIDMLVTIIYVMYNLNKQIF